MNDLHSWQGLVVAEQLVSAAESGDGEFARSIIEVQKSPAAARQLLWKAELLSTGAPALADPGLN